jgi:hypothetical protein
MTSVGSVGRLAKIEDERELGNLVRLIPLCFALLVLPALVLHFSFFCALPDSRLRLCTYLCTYGEGKNACVRN